MPRTKKPSDLRIQFQKALITDDTWVTAVLIDADRREGEKTSYFLYSFEVVRPLIHAGRHLVYAIHARLDKSLETLAGNFEGLNFLDEHAVYEALGGIPVRLHVAIDPPRTDENGTDHPARNRITGLYPNRNGRPPKSGDAGEAAAS